MTYGSSESGRVRTPSRRHPARGVLPDARGYDDAGFAVEVAFDALGVAALMHEVEFLRNRDAQVVDDLADVEAGQEPTQQPLDDRESQQVGAHDALDARI